MDIEKDQAIIDKVAKTEKAKKQKRPNKKIKKIKIFNNNQE